MDDALRKQYDAIRRLDDKSFASACYAPFVSMFFTTHGKVLACCKNGSYVLGDVRTTRLPVIWKGEPTRQMRQALRDYKFHLDCAYCEWEIAGGNRRTATALLFDEFRVDSDTPDWPQQIEFEGSNICNFECIMCNGDTSSSIRANRDGLPAAPRVYGDEFFDDLRPFLPHLKRARFFGGEPFLTPESHRIWELMIQDGLATPCHVTTNGSQFNAKVERVLSALPFTVVVSIDGATAETVEKIRVNCRFPQLVENIGRFQKYAMERGTSCRLAFCLMRQNWHEFIDLLIFGEERGLEVLVNTVIDPSMCSLYSLPSRDLARVVSALERDADSRGDQLVLNRRPLTEALIKLKSATTGPQTATMTIVLDRFFMLDNPMRAADAAIADGKYSEALETLRQVSDTSADYYYALAARAHCLTVLGDLDEADRLLARACGLSQKRPEAFLGLARLRMKQDRPAEAADLARRARSLARDEDPLGYQADEVLALALLRQGRLVSATRALAPVARLQRHGSEVQQRVYPRTGLRPSLAREVERFPETRRARLRVHAASLLLEAGRRTVPRQHTDEVDDDSMPRSGGTTAALLAPRLPRWNLRVATGSAARLILSAAEDGQARVDITEARGREFDIQLNQLGYDTKSNRSYRLCFRARSDAPRGIAVGVARAHDPWDNLGLYRELDLADSWVDYEEVFVADSDENHARIHFDIGLSTVAVEIAAVALRELGEPSTSVERHPITDRSADRQAG